jgi:8-oxo-dGTP pyrophosphatase MutT (NUDIX family)
MGKTVFPGGKAEGTCSQHEEAAREVSEEVHITLNPESLCYAGRLLVEDNRPGFEAFGNVFIYMAKVEVDTVATETAEFKPRWEPIYNQEFISEMPDDVQYWWPGVRDFDGTPKTTHVIRNEGRDLEIAIKDRDLTSFLAMDIH